MRQIRAAAPPRPLLICVNGLSNDMQTIHRVFRDPFPRQGQTGRRLQPQRGTYIAQVMKQYAGRRVVAVRQRIVQDWRAAVQRMIERSQGAGWINTAYIERLNATFRVQLRHLVRRVPTLTHGMYLVGTVHNFRTYHRSLRVRR
ncbi:MAG: hypothetical protein IT318_24620 [Anaerolineales bacterium]|nr:hypothetical protein [Anaerolineales bacterium]